MPACDSQIPDYCPEPEVWGIEVERRATTIGGFELEKIAVQCLVASGQSVGFCAQTI
jgi:hypothetical protein